MVRTKQGGSVLAFIVGAILLVTLLAGGVYWISQQNKGTTTPLPPPPPPETRLPEESLLPSREDDQQKSQEVTNTPTQLPSDARPVSNNELPATGPREVLATSFILALVSGIAVSYLRSRRKLTSL